MLSFLSPRPLGTEAATTPMRTWRDETKWRRSWRRGSTTWCVHVDALIRNTPSFPPVLTELDSDQRKQLLSSQACWRLERGDMCRSPASSLLSENRNQRLQRGNRRRDRVERDYFIYRSSSCLPFSPWSLMRRLEPVICRLGREKLQTTNRKHPEQTRQNVLHSEI